MRQVQAVRPYCVRSAALWAGLCGAVRCGVSCQMVVLSNPATGRLGKERAKEETCVPLTWLDTL